MKFLAIILLVAICFAGQRTETNKIIVADTITEIKIDTTKTVKYDTLIITKVVNDTSLVVSVDTAKVKTIVKTKKK